MAEQTQAVEQPATESPADLDSLLEAKFGRESDSTRQTEAAEAAEAEQPEGEAEASADEASEAEVSEQTDLVDVEIDGEVWQVPPKIKDRIMAERDYTLKTTEVANTRRALELQQKEIALYQEQRTFEQSVAADLDNLKMIDAYVSETEKSTDWAKLNTDEIVRTRLQLDQLRARRDELKNALGTKWQEFRAKQDAERSKLKETAKEVLSKAIPSWSDETKGSIEKYVQTMGYPEVAVPNMSALDYQIAWKAMQYDTLKANAKGAVKKASEAPVIAPTARKAPMPQKVRSKLDLRNAVKTGKQENISAALDKRLEQMFGG